MNEPKKIRELVGNKIFSVTFEKKDGTLREMTCRLDVKKHLKGGEKTYDTEAANHLTVFDMQKKGYRTININTLKRLTVDGVSYDID